MQQPDRSPLNGSVFALAVTMTALLLSLLFRPVLDPIIYFLFLLSTWVSTRYYGRLGGLVAIIASIPAMVYFFLTPFPAVRRLLGIVVAGGVVGGYLASRTCRSWERRRLLHGVVAFGSALGLLESGLIDPVVARQAFPLAESGEVFRRLLEGSSDGFLKAIVSPAHG